MNKSLLSMVYGGVVLFFASSVIAEDITITNEGFETVLPPGLGNGAFFALDGTGGKTSPGWSDVNGVGNSLGVFNPLVGSEPGVVGSNVAFSNSTTGIGRQALTDTLKPGVYTLSARVGSQTEGTRNPLVRLTAGGTTLVEENSIITAGAGMRNIARARIGITGAHANLGQALGIDFTLGSNLGQSLFDDFHLDFTPGRLVAINEHSFEGAALGENGFVFAVPGAWTGTAGVGTFNNPNSGTEFVNGPPIGQDFVFMTGAGGNDVLSQILTETLEAGTLYTLSAELGTRGAAPDYSLGLYADGTLLGEVTQDDFALANDFSRAMFTVDSGLFSGSLGDQLEVRLTRFATPGAGQLVVDDFSLVALAVPEPGSICVWLLAGMIGLAIGRRIFRRAD